MAIESFLDKYNDKIGTPGLEFEVGMLFDRNIKFNHAKIFTMLSGMTADIEILEHLDVYYATGVRKTMYFIDGVNQKSDSAQIKEHLEQPFVIKRHIEGVKHIKAKLSKETPREIPTGHPQFLRFKLRVRFRFPGKKWTAELDLIKEVKAAGADLKSIKNVLFKKYSIENLLNSIEYSVFDELRLEFEYAGTLTMDEFFEPVNLFSQNLNGDDNYQRQIFMLARNIIFNKKAYLESFRSRSGLKKLLNNVLEVNADTFYKKVQPLLPQSKFFVTDKIDGLRTIIGIGKKCFLLNNKLTALEGSSDQVTYVDCELVGDTAYAFDVITFKGEVVSTKPFAERLKLLTAAAEHASAVTGMAVVPKEFVLLDENWQAQLKEFYTKKRTYGTDGMIFTPNDDSDYQSMLGYKWKPAEHSTIDFYMEKVTGGYALMSGASAEDIHKLGLRTITRIEKKPLNPVLFTPSDAPEVYFYETEREDLDKKIGEFGWKNGKWHLHRIRTDRDVELARGEYYGNYFKVAETIWYSIHNPLTFQDLFKDSDGYFAEDNSEKYKTQRNFNSKVKTEVLTQYIEKLKDNNSLGLVVDLAAGKGQDMARLFNLGVSDAIFVDNDANAIQELIRRKHTLYKTTKGKTKVTTALVDLSTDYKKVLKKITDAYGGKVNASMVICNFAIHYFTESFEMFSNLVSLVKSLLADNGIFIFTCFDGQKVFDLCGENGWSHEDKYSIVPMYKSRSLEPFGQKVKLILPFSKGEYYEEYLVNLNMVASVLEDNNFSKQAIESFDKFHAGSKLTDDEKTFTGLYSYCVFQKTNEARGGHYLGAAEKTNSLNDDRDLLINLPVANSIRIKTNLKGAPLQFVVDCFQRQGFRNKDTNKRLKKKVFTFEEVPTDTTVTILNANVENYMQWITKFCTNKILIGDCAVVNEEDETQMVII